MALPERRRIRLVSFPRIRSTPVRWPRSSALRMMFGGDYLELLGPPPG